MKGEKSTKKRKNERIKGKRQEGKRKEEKMRKKGGGLKNKKEEH